MDVWVVEEYYTAKAHSDGPEFIANAIQGIFSSQEAAESFVAAMPKLTGHCYYDVTQFSVED